MTERSRFWNSTGPGDATEAPYDAPTEFAQVLMAAEGGHNITRRAHVCNTHQTLTPSVPGANTLRVAAGTAFVYGSWYENDATIDTTIPTPAGATRNDVIVLRKSWASQTVRLTRIAGTEGAGVPAISNVVGTTWDMEICHVAITTGAVMTVTDRRQLSASDFMVAEEFRLANAASRRVLIDEATVGGLLIVCTDAGGVAQYLLQGGVNNATLINGTPASTFTDALGTASRINVDWNATEYQIQNNSGAERLFRVFLIRGF